MCCNQENCEFSGCSVLGILISVVFGAVIGVLFAFGLIPNILVSVWIVFGLGVLSLIILAVGVYTGAVNAFGALSKCLCRHISCLLAGIVGTILFSLIALSIVLDFTLVAVIIFVAIAAFFFALLVVELIAFFYCIVCRMCYIRKENCR